MQVNTISELKSAVELLSKADVIAIDTEFLRDKTYYPLLCLIQIADQDRSILIDCLAIDDLSALTPLLINPEITKVFHACAQDREMLFNACGVVPSPVFDTQIAAPLLGLQQQISLKSLLLNILGINLNKKDSLTDWSKRPLSKSQIEYSLDDVRHLIPLYHEMCKRLDSMGRRHWLDHEFEALSKDNISRVTDGDLWKKVKKTNSLNREQLACVQQVALWRENFARKKNLPRRWIIGDELVVEIAKRAPLTLEEMYTIRGVKEKISAKSAREIIAALNSVLKSDPQTWPVRDKKKPMAENADAIADIMTGLLRTIAKQNKLTHQVLATHDDLLLLASGYRDNLDILKGWRYDIAGKALLDLLEGRISVSIDDGNICFLKDQECDSK